MVSTIAADPAATNNQNQGRHHHRRRRRRGLIYVVVVFFVTVSTVLSVVFYAVCVFGDDENNNNNCNWLSTTTTTTRSSRTTTTMTNVVVGTPDRRKVPIGDLLGTGTSSGSAAIAGVRPSSNPHCLFLPTRGWGNNVYIALTFVVQAEMARNRLIQQQQQQQAEGGGKRMSATTGIDLRDFTPCDLMDEVERRRRQEEEEDDDDDETQYCVNYTFPCILPDEDEIDYVAENNISSSDILPFSFGRIFTDLFVNMHLCPTTTTNYFNKSSCPEFATSLNKQHDVHWMWVAQTVIDEYQKQLRRRIRKKKKQVVVGNPVFDHDGDNMFELNSTYIEYVMEQADTKLTLRQLLELFPRPGLLCTVQIRFGDYWTRRNSDKDKRLCPLLEKQIDGDQQRCFEEQIGELFNRACPDPTVPVYIATDWDEFLHYVCTNHGVTNRTNMISNATTTSTTEEEREGISLPPLQHQQRKKWWNLKGKHQPDHHQQRRLFLNRCPDLNGSSSQRPLQGSKHTHDIDLSTAAGRLTTYEMITDWIVLIVGKSCELRSRLKYGKKGTQYRQYRSTFVSSTCFDWVIK